MKNTLIILLIIIVVILAYFVFLKPKDVNIDYQIPVDDKENPKTSTLSQNTITWESLNFGGGLYYPSDWVATADRYQSPGQEAQGLPREITGYTFILPGESTFAVGGHQPMDCEAAHIQPFVYGVSTSACYKGTAIAITPDANQADKNAFGDFVIKNR